MLAQYKQLCGSLSTYLLLQTLLYLHDTGMSSGCAVHLQERGFEIPFID
jgi:hypothetical protein